MSKRRVKFLEPEQIEAAIREVEVAAKTYGIRVALVGGLAMQVYGSDRLTLDVDFAADGVYPLEKSRPLSFGGVQGYATNGVKVDLIVRGDDYADLYQTALEAATFDSDIGSRVVLVEYLAAMKVAAARPKDDADLAYLITEGALDTVRTREIIKRFLGVYAAHEFDNTVRIARWEALKPHD